MWVVIVLPKSLILRGKNWLFFLMWSFSKTWWWPQRKAHIVEKVCSKVLLLKSRKKSLKLYSISWVNLGCVIKCSWNHNSRENPWNRPLMKMRSMVASTYEHLSEGRCFWNEHRCVSFSLFLYKVCIVCGAPLWKGTELFDWLVL